MPSGYYQNTPMLGRLLAEWPRTTGALYLVPLWNPVILAEQVATLAAIARDRFILQVALGGGEEQFGAMGVRLRDRVRRFEAGLDIVRRLLAGEEVSTEAPFPTHRARISPLPVEPIQVWLAGHAPPALARAARLADGMGGRARGDDRRSGGTRRRLPGSLRGDSTPPGPDRGAP